MLIFMADDDDDDDSYQPSRIWLIVYLYPHHALELDERAVVVVVC